VCDLDVTRAAVEGDAMTGFKRPRRVPFVPESGMPRTTAVWLLHRVLRERLVRDRLARKVEAATGS
jgi:acyl-CoA synthetase (AMP-forming)/AMP-acid ligase II